MLLSDPYLSLVANPASRPSRIIYTQTNCVILSLAVVTDFVAAGNTLLDPDPSITTRPYSNQGAAPVFAQPFPRRALPLVLTGRRFSPNGRSN